MLQTTYLMQAKLCSLLFLFLSFMHPLCVLYRFLCSLSALQLGHRMNQCDVVVERTHLLFCRASPLPFELADAARSTASRVEAAERGEVVSTVDQENRLDIRHLDLRTPANQAIFRIQSAVCQQFRASLLKQGFQVPSWRCHTSCTIIKMYLLHYSLALLCFPCGVLGVVCLVCKTPQHRFCHCLVLISFAVWGHVFL